MSREVHPWRPCRGRLGRKWPQCMVRPCVARDFHRSVGVAVLHQRVVLRAIMDISTAAFGAHHTGSGEIGAILVGMIAVAVFRLPIVRTAFAPLFAVPAAVAGYYAASHKSEHQ